MAVKDISETAFLTNLSRAKRADLSLDAYARLWVTPRVESMWDELAREGYPNDDVSSSLRNRFYLELLRDFATSRDFPVCINVGSGFSDYPYLIDAPCRFVEIDYPHILAYKKEKTTQWEARGLLPRRNVVHFGADLSTEEDISAIGKALPDWLAGGTAMVIMEGITYYLAQNSLDELFTLYSRLLPAGSLIAFEHWPPDAMTYPVFARLSAYLTERFDWDPSRFTLLSEEYVSSIPGFSLAVNEDLASVERRWSTDRLFEDRASRLPLFFKALRKD